MRSLPLRRRLLDKAAGRVEKQMGAEHGGAQVSSSTGAGGAALTPPLQTAAPSLRELSVSEMPGTPGHPGGVPRLSPYSGALREAGVGELREPMSGLCGSGAVGLGEGCSGGPWASGGGGCAGG